MINVKFSRKLMKTFIALVVSLSLFSVILSSGTSTVHAASDVDNLLVNPGFEEGTSGWNFWQPNFSITDETARTGSRSVKFTRTEVTWQNVNQYVNVTPDTEYLVEIYAKGNAMFELSARKTDDWSHLGSIYEQPGEDEWTKYSLSFNSGTNSQVIIYIGEITNGKTYFDDASLVTAVEVERGKLPEGPRLKEISGSTLIGTRVNNIGTNNDIGKYVISREFNSVQPTWYLNWGGWDAPEIMNTESFNSWVNLAEEKGLQGTMMHLFIGPDQYTPDWLTKGAWTANELDSMLQNLVKTVLEQNANKDKVKVWNLVNEAFNFNNTGKYWGDDYQVFNKLGWEADQSGLTGDDKMNDQHPAYIRKIFEYAHAVAPNAILELRDTGMDFTPNSSKGKAFYQLVKHLVNTGVPIGAVGLQAHVGSMNAFLDWNGLKENIQRFKMLGIEVYLTEVDIGDTSQWNAEKADKQKVLYQRLFTAAREAGAEGVYVWGLIDTADSWRRDEDPLLFDKYYNPKPAYYGVQNALINTGMFAIKAKGTKGGEKIQLRLDDEVVEEWYLSKTLADYCFMGHTNGSKNVKIEFVNASDGGSVNIEKLTISGQDYKPENYPTTANTAPSSVMNKNGYIDFGTVAAVEYDPLRALPDEAVVELRQSQIKYGTITVDGVVDNAWSNANTVRTDRYTGSIKDGTAAEADVRTLWDENYLYALFEVHDPFVTIASPNVWEQDSVEIFFDETNAKSGGFHSHSIQIRVNAEGSVTSNPSANMPAGFLSNAAKTDYGYLVECAIPWYDQSKAAVNQEIGFDAQVNDDMDGNGTRDGVATWNDMTGTGWQGPSVYGTMKLVKGEAPTTIKADAELVGTTAKAVIALDRIEAAIEAAEADDKGTRNVCVIVKAVEGAKAYQVMLPASVMVKKDGDVNILVKTPSAEAVMPNDIFKNDDLKNAHNVGILIERVGTAELDLQTRKKVGNRPVLKLQAIKDDQVIKWNNPQAPVEISMDYTLQDGEDPNAVIVYYIDGKGKLQMIKDARCDVTSGKAVFTITSF